MLSSPYIGTSYVNCLFNSRKTRMQTCVNISCIMTSSLQWRTPCHTAHFININHSACFFPVLQDTSWLLVFLYEMQSSYRNATFPSRWLKWFNTSRCCSWQCLHPSWALDTTICPGFNITSHIIEVHYVKNVQEDQDLISQTCLEKNVTKPFLQQNSKSTVE